MWAEEQAQRCSECGTWDWEWKENPDAWHPDIWRCEGCRRKAELRRHISSEMEMRHASDEDGLQIRMFRTPRED
ncbi:MAG: hypothetical protein L0Z49_07195 [Actinobacteria bacterium]|nr:hypothetical protein [Actinomycetota bacterium]